MTRGWSAIRLKDNVIIIIVVMIIVIKSCHNASYTQSIRVCIQHAYHEIITEELGAFVSKLSVVASCSEIVVMICFIRSNDDKTWFGLVMLRLTGANKINVPNQYLITVE